MSLRYRNDVIVSIWIRHRNDMDSMSKSLSFRCRIHMVTISRWHYRFDMDSTSQRYGFDIATIWIRCRIHMVTIMSLRCRNDMDSTSYRYRNDIESISLRYRNDVIVSICIRHRNDNDFDIESISLRC